MRRGQIYIALLVLFGLSSIQFLSKSVEFDHSRAGDNFHDLMLGSGILFFAILIIAFFDRPKQGG
jgi:hypothetical protein